MLLGYFDAMRMLYGLEGRIYYLDAPESEEYYFNRLMAEVLELMDWCGMGAEHTEKKEGGSLRIYMEELFPRLAAKLGLKEKWGLQAALFFPFWKKLQRNIGSAGFGSIRRISF